MIKPTTRFVVLLLSLAVFNSPLLAQHKPEVTRKPAATTPAVETNVTFDSLIPADTYKIYFEVRNVGQLVESPAINDILDPATKLLGGDAEPKHMIKWLKKHAERLSTCRLLVVAWPSKQLYPTAVLALEFPSAEEAQKMGPEFANFIPSSPTANQTPGQPANDPPFRITRLGSLLLLTEKTLPRQLLSPSKSKRMAEDSNFVVARNRFASESLFLYVDMKAIEREEEEQRQKWQEEERRRLEEEAKKPKPEPSVSEPIFDEADMQPGPELIAQTAMPEPSPSPARDPATETKADDQTLNLLMNGVYRSFFSGQTKWPEAIAAAANFEEEAYVVRALILNEANSRTLPIPFLPHVLSGPALAPQSPNVLPGDASLFITASLDFSQSYDDFLRTFALETERDRNNPAAAIEVSTSSPFAEYEKRLGLKIRDDVLPLLGNEMALAFLPKPLEPDTTATKNNTITKPSDPDPIAAFAIKDRDAVRRLIPRIIESVGIKGAAALAQTERRDDTEIVSYGNYFSYAFAGNFLLFSPDAAVTKRAVDAYLSGDVLAANNHFRNSKRWQSREVLAQIYVSPLSVQQFGLTPRTTNNAWNEIAARFGTIDPVSYTISSDVSGPLHELHIPKNLLSLILATAVNDTNTRSLEANEYAAMSNLHTVVSAEETYKATTGNGHYGSLDQLVTAGLVSAEISQRYGYRIELTASATNFEATAVPIEYDKTGKRSFFIDQSAVLRGGDHGGGPATVADPPTDFAH